MPGTNSRAAQVRVREELARDGGVPHLAETPARGPGADMVGRTMGILAGTWSPWAVETTPTGWRLADAIGRDVRRAMSYLTEDLDLIEELYSGWQGPIVLPVAGPWTLASAVELHSGERMLRDPGAVRDLTQTLGEAAAAQAAAVRRRLGGAVPTIQLDEPALPTVLAGGVPTASGAHRYRAVDPAVIRAGLRTVVDRLAADGVDVVVHCCGATVPYTLLAEAGVAGVGIDLALLQREEEDQLGSCLEAGVRMSLGVSMGLPMGLPLGIRPSDLTDSVRTVLDLGHRLGFGQAELVAGIAITSPCGLAGFTPQEASAAMAHSRAVGRALREDDPDER